MKESTTLKTEALEDMRARTLSRSMSSLEQAAILMLSISDDVAAGVLRHFSREEIVSLSQAMARLNNVKQPMVGEVIGRFFDDFKQQSSIMGASRGYLSGCWAKPWAAT